MKEKIILKCLFFMIIVSLAATVFEGKKRGEIQIYNSSSVRMGSYYSERITVVVNERKISGRKEYAMQIVKKCRENSFQDVRFSYDLSKPNELEVTVCLDEKQAEKGEAEFRFRYAQKEADGIYNIIDHPEKFYVQILPD